MTADGLEVVGVCVDLVLAAQVGVRAGGERRLSLEGGVLLGDTHHPIGVGGRHHFVGAGDANLGLGGEALGIARTPGVVGVLHRRHDDEQRHQRQDGERDRLAPPFVHEESQHAGGHQGCEQRPVVAEVAALEVRHEVIQHQPHQKQAGHRTGDAAHHERALAVVGLALVVAVAVAVVLAGLRLLEEEVEGGEDAGTDESHQQSQGPEVGIEDHVFCSSALGAVILIQNVTSWWKPAWCSSPTG
ncbi:MAG: hypothetical protein BWY75_01706 [bacterium ADurb.Bin425]|nr:MAG: hypothetical protein BWY75_01706 [bacterium ADurb.Bin425]